MSEFRLVEIGIISLRDALSSGHIPIMNAFIRDQGGEVRVLECVLWKADSEGRGGEGAVGEAGESEVMFLCICTFLIWL